MMVEVETHKFCESCPYLDIVCNGESMPEEGKPQYICSNYYLCKRLVEWLEAQMEK